MTVTGTQIIGRVLTDLRVLGVGRQLTDRDASMALVHVQEQMEAWRLRSRVIYTATRSPFTLVSGQVSRTIGPTGNFSFTPKPTMIAKDGASVLPVGHTNELPVNILTRDEYFEIPDKTETADYPYAVQMEIGQTNNTLYFWPVPQTAATLYLLLPTIGGFSDLTTSLILPDGYHELFRRELAPRLAEPFGKPITDEMLRKVRETEALIASRTDQGPPKSETDGALSDWPGGWYDVYSDTIR